MRGNVFDEQITPLLKQAIDIARDNGMNLLVVCERLDGRVNVAGTVRGEQSPAFKALVDTVVANFVLGSGQP